MWKFLLKAFENGVGKDRERGIRADDINSVAEGSLVLEVWSCQRTPES